MTDRINVRTLGIACRDGVGTPVLEGRGERDEWTVYSFRCPVERADAEAPPATVLVEVPRDLDVTPEAGDANAGDGGPAARFNLRNLSIKCADCPGYPILAAFRREEDHNVYTYECEQQPCHSGIGEIWLTVPHELDKFARRDPNWRGGGRHGAEGDGAPED